MLRVTKLTDYGVGLMTSLAERPTGAMVTASDLSDDLQLPLPTVRKILKTLTRENLLVSHRGVSGGYSLARQPGEITLMDMVAALEGPMGLTECSTGEACGCDREVVCGLKENWSLVNSLVQRTLDSYTLDQMTGTLPHRDEPRNMQSLSGMGGRG
jgi:FeS assembly SUF system regulator